jgi:4-amino-4-deoxy-L-arabinose transferase-like glycosyltransferase
VAHVTGTRRVDIAPVRPRPRQRVVVCAVTAVVLPSPALAVWLGPAGRDHPAVPAGVVVAAVAVAMALTLVAAVAAHIRGLRRGPRWTVALMLAGAAGVVGGLTLQTLLAPRNQVEAVLGVMLAGAVVCMHAVASEVPRRPPP